MLKLRIVHDGGREYFIAVHYFEWTDPREVSVITYGELSTLDSVSNVYLLLETGSEREIVSPFPVDEPYDEAVKGFSSRLLEERS